MGGGGLNVNMEVNEYRYYEKFRPRYSYKQNLLNKAEEYRSLSIKTKLDNLHNFPKSQMIEVKKYI